MKQEINVLYIHYYKDQDDSGTAEVLSIMTGIDVQYHHLHDQIPEDTSEYDLVLCSGLTWQENKYPDVKNLVVLSAAYWPVAKAKERGIPAVDRAGLKVYDELAAIIKEASEKKYLQKT
jgi:hypothetical protein